MEVWIFEDEARAVRRLTRLIEEVDPRIQVAQVADSVDAASKLLASGTPDVLLCDIQLADGLSFEIFRVHPPKYPVIFTTAFDQYALDAFRNGGVEYLLKPINPEDLHRALDKARKLSNVQPTFDPALLMGLLTKQNTHFKDRYLVQFSGKLRSIDSKDIVCFFSEAKVTVLRTIEKEYVVDSTLETIESELDPAAFFRVNRGLLVAHAGIDEVIPWSNSRVRISVKGWTRNDLVVSRERTKAFKTWLGA